ncbi:uncharacterized protein LOC119263823 [Pygocentrus nattereri]|uniref:uncharacterized protein LOC119263823 n=1 Tax=Pygocentrus nattereri TaxID=42514 RepID=UPI001890D62E|nr:uncharacterized protein LOC119263823 [Pygocentrus nattereri]
MWYKQRLEHAPLEVGSQLEGKSAVISDQFDRSRFKLNRTASGISLSIERVTKEDEGMYFCGATGKKTLEFSTATFLAVTGQLNTSVLQTAVQCCSLYEFSKNILDQHHTGTYYCAVVVCGKIIFGNGTSVELKDPVVPVMLTLAVFSAVCVAVICTQTILIHKLRKSEHCAERVQQGAVSEWTTRQDSDSEEFDFTALRFSEKMKRRALKEKVFTRVRFFPVSDYRALQ